MCPQQHFGSVDNDCVPRHLFEVPDLVALATSQMQWIDLVDLAPDDRSTMTKSVFCWSQKRTSTFWPMPNTCPSSTPDAGEVLPVRWPKKAHPGALSEAGQERTPWLTRWTRATGCLSVLRHLNTCSRLAAFFPIACALSFFMLLGKIGVGPTNAAALPLCPMENGAEQVGIPAVQAVPLPNLRDGVLHAVNLLPELQQQEFRAAHTDAVESTPTQAESVETLAPLILEDRVKNASQNHSWALVLKHMADHHGFWFTTATAPPPDCAQIHCGGLGGGALGGSDAPTFDCTNPRVDGTCVYGPSLADLPGKLTVQPCMRWQELGFGRASILYRRTQIIEAARLLPAHRRLPHATFLNGLWWKLLALQPERIVACLPNLRPSSRSHQCS